MHVGRRNIANLIKREGALVRYCRFRPECGDRGDEGFIAPRRNVHKAVNAPTEALVGARSCVIDQRARSHPQTASVGCGKDAVALSGKISKEAPPRNPRMMIALRCHV